MYVLMKKECARNTEDNRNAVHEVSDDHEQVSQPVEGDDKTKHHSEPTVKLTQHRTAR